MFKNYVLVNYRLATMVACKLKVDFKFHFQDTIHPHRQTTMAHVATCVYMYKFNVALHVHVRCLIQGLVVSLCAAPSCTSQSASLRYLLLALEGNQSLKWNESWSSKVYNFDFNIKTDLHILQSQIKRMNLMIVSMILDKVKTKRNLECPNSIEMKVEVLKVITLTLTLQQTCTYCTVKLKEWLFQWFWLSKLKQRVVLNSLMQWPVELAKMRTAWNVCNS